MSTARNGGPVAGDDLAGRRVVVTGAQGFLGRRLVALCLALGASVRGLGRSARSDTHYTHHLAWRGSSVRAPLADLVAPARDDAYEYEQVDLAAPDAGEAIASFDPDVILHSAASLRDEGWSSLFASNIDSLRALFDAVEGRDAMQVVLVSSGSVYGMTPPGRLPHREGDACEPADLYAASKLAGEHVATVLARERGIDLVVARVFNLLGPGLQDRHLAGSLAGQVAAIAAGVAQPVLRLGTLDTTRDFIDVRDAAAAILHLVLSGTSGVVNIASGAETPTQLVFDELLAAAGLGTAGAVTIDRLPGRPVDQPRSVASVERLAEAGFAWSHEVASSLRDMVAYYLDHVAASASSS